MEIVLEISHHQDTSPASLAKLKNKLFGFLSNFCGLSNSCIFPPSKTITLKVEKKLKFVIVIYTSDWC